MICSGGERMRFGRTTKMSVLPLTLLLGTAAAAAPMSDGMPAWNSVEFLLAAALSCKQVNSCEEALQLWCDGYRRADGDGDGIPCENVCHSKEQVDLIRAQIGC